MKGTLHFMTWLTRKTILAAVLFIMFITFLVKMTPPRENVLPKDYYQLIDIRFQFLHAPACKQTYNFIILVHTAPGNLDKRNLLRETWANVNESDVEIFFLTGLDSDEIRQKKLNEEIRQYKNFIQGDFLDTYKNLTYKHVMGLKYVYYHCPTIEYVVKVDDDMFVNVHVFKKFFEMFRQRYGPTSNILCSTMIGNIVLREGKWAVSTREYPNTTYPPHCSGFALIYPKKAVELIYNEAQKTIFFWIDDVHVTGTVAKDARVGHTDISALIMNDIELNIIRDQKLTLEMRPILFGPMETGKENIRYISQYMKIYGKKISILDYLNN